MLKLLQCEYMKLKRSKFLMIGILGTLIVPFFVITKAFANNSPYSIHFFSLYSDAFMFLMLLFAPMVLTILGAWIISREYTDGTLKNIFAITVSKTSFLLGKLLFFAILSILFMMVSLLEVWVLALICSFFFPVTGLTFSALLYIMAKAFLGGILLYAAQMPFLYLTVRTKGFIVPLVTAAAVLLINVVLSGSSIAGYYPWSASYHLISGQYWVQNCSKGISLLIILAVGLLGGTACLIHFRREEF